jgi:hypothetical protein
MTGMTNLKISKNKLLEIKCALVSSTNFVCNISHSKKNSARYLNVNVDRSSRKAQRNLQFLDIYCKNTQIPSFMKIRPMEAEMSMRKYGRKHGRTVMTKLRVAFRNFAKASKHQTFNAVCWNHLLVLGHSWKVYILRGQRISVSYTCWYTQKVTIRFWILHSLRTSMWLLISSLIKLN